MSKSIKVVFIKQGKKEKEGSVYVRTIENSIVRKKSLKIKLSESHWNKYFNEDTQRFRHNQTFPNSEKYNTIIDGFFQELNSVGNDIELLPDSKKSFLSFWKRFIETTENHGTKIKHQVVYNKLWKYLLSKSKTDLLFKDITPFFIRELKIYLKTSKDPKSLSNNSINHYLKIIKSIINHSQKNGYYIYLINPFTSISFSNETREKQIITERELSLLQNTPIEDNSLDLTRKMFLFQLFSNGMRVSDLLLLRWNMIIDRRLKYKMYKTDELINIPINLNMGLILTDLLGKGNRYTDLLDNFTETYNEDGKEFNLTIRDVEERISKISVREENLLRPDKIKLENNKKVNKTDGYYYDEKNKLKFLKLLKFKFDLLTTIDLSFTLGLMGSIHKIKESKNFIFPILKNNDFKNIESDNDFTKISLEQYNTIKHSTIVYNRKLKLVGNICKIETNLSSHVSRHSFTNLLLNMDNVNLYDISQSLGHKNITITQNYIRTGFNNKKIDYLNKDLDNKHRKTF